MPVKMRVAKTRRPMFSDEVLGLFVKLEKRRPPLFSDEAHELARVLDLVPEFWTGNSVLDRSAAPCRPPQYIATQHWFRCRAVRAALIDAVQEMNCPRLPAATANGADYVAADSSD